MTLNLPETLAFFMLGMALLLGLIRLLLGPGSPDRIVAADVFARYEEIARRIESGSSVQAACALEGCLRGLQAVGYRGQHRALENQGVVGQRRYAHNAQRIERGLAANAAARRRVEMPLQPSQVNLGIGAQLYAHDVVIAAVGSRRATGFYCGDITLPADNGLAVQEASREFAVVAGGAHCDRDAACCAAVGGRVGEPNLERLLDRDLVVSFGPVAVNDLADVDCVTASGHGADALYCPAGQYISAPQKARYCC